MFNSLSLSTKHIFSWPSSYHFTLVHFLEPVMIDPGEAPETSAVYLAQVFLLGDAWKDSFILFFTFSVGI